MGKTQICQSQGVHLTSDSFFPSIVLSVHAQWIEKRYYEANVPTFSKDNTKLKTQN